MLNAKHLGASLQDKAVVEAVGSSFNAQEVKRLVINGLQLMLFATLLVLHFLGEHRAAVLQGGC